MMNDRYVYTILDRMNDATNWLRQTWESFWRVLSDTGLGVAIWTALSTGVLWSVLAFQWWGNLWAQLLVYLMVAFITYIGFMTYRRRVQQRFNQTLVRIAINRGIEASARGEGFKVYDADSGEHMATLPPTFDWNRLRDDRPWDSAQWNNSSFLRDQSPTNGGWPMEDWDTEFGGDGEGDDD